MVSKKITAFFLCSTLLVGSLLTGCGTSEKSSLTDLSNIDVRKLPINTIQASFICDPDNPREVAGAADYIFAGKVISNDGTEYQYVAPLEDENGNIVETGVPYTHYTVQVIENIKGALQEEEPISLVKSGGIEQNQKSISLYENDCLPEAEKAYIFVAYTQEDGSLLVSGPNSNTLIPVEAPNKIVKSQEYKKYKEAAAHQIVPEAIKNAPGTTVSIYDKKYEKTEQNLRSK